MSSKRVVGSGSQKVDMKDVVNCHSRRELEAEGERTDSFDDLVGAKAFPV